MNAAALSHQATAAMRVFVVEDSPVVCERLQEMVADIDGACAIGTAAGAKAAIAAILAAQPDVVMLDLRLAQGSGLDVLRALRAQAPAIGVYMLSNFSDAPYRRFAARLGALDFFDKSTEFERVRETLTARALTAIHRQQRQLTH
jgi:DNA-binding NarL/FixJ family response regulator